jgi:hypothetical protein
MGNSKTASGRGLLDWTVKFDFYAIVRLQEEFGINLMVKFEEILSDPTKLSYLAWAGFLHQDKELTRDALMERVSSEGVSLADIMSKVSQGMIESMGASSDGEELEDEKEQLQATNTAT